MRPIKASTVLGAVFASRWSRPGCFGCGFGHVAALLGMAVIAVTLAMIDLRVRVHPNLRHPTRRYRCRRYRSRCLRGCDLRSNVRWHGSLRRRRAERLNTTMPTACTTSMSTGPGASILTSCRNRRSLSLGCLKHYNKAGYKNKASSKIHGVTPSAQDIRRLPQPKPARPSATRSAGPDR